VGYHQLSRDSSTYLRSLSLSLSLSSTHLGAACGEASLGAGRVIVVRLVVAALSPHALHARSLQLLQPLRRRRRHLCSRCFELVLVWKSELFSTRECIEFPPPPWSWRAARARRGCPVPARARSCTYPSPSDESTWFKQAVSTLCAVSTSSWTIWGGGHRFVVG
jgi:hypothetical protein